MATPDFFGEPRTPRLAALLNEIRTGQLQIPRFQRPFVWDDEQRLALLDSIYRGYPIGSILIWRTQHYRIATYSHLGPARLPRTDALVRQYILDGHQRLATLYAALGPGLEPDEDMRALWRSAMEDDEDERDWPIYFVLEDEDSERNPFRLKPRGAVPEDWLPLEIVFDSYALGEFKDRLRQRGRRRQLVNKVQSVADSFRDYPVPVIPIVAEALDQVTTSFKRVNSGGTAMSEVHMLNALTWTEGFDLLERLDNIVHDMDDVGWGKLDPQAIIHVCKALMGLDIYKADMEEVGKKLRSEPHLLDQASEAVRRAAVTLGRVVNVRGPGILPYAYQLVLLAVVLEDQEQPLSATKDEAIRRWFWATTLSEYFTGMTNSLFYRAQIHLKQVLAGSASPVPADAQPRTQTLRTFDFRGARSRGMALLLAELKPQNPQDPFDMLATYGKDCVIRLISGDEVLDKYRALIAGPANRFLVPPQGARTLRQALTDHDLFLEFRQTDGLEFAAKHAITADALVSLRGGDIVGFLSQRQDTLSSLERERWSGLLAPTRAA